MEHIPPPVTQKGITDILRAFPQHRQTFGRMFADPNGETLVPDYSSRHRQILIDNADSVRCCAVAAIALTCFTDHRTPGIAAVKHLEQLDIDCAILARWNDDAHMTFRQIADLIDAGKARRFSKRIS